MSGDEVLEGSGVAALVAPEGMRTPGGIGHGIREAPAAQPPLIAVERTSPRRFVVGDEGARLLESRRLHVVWSGPVGAERVCGEADERRLCLSAQAVPVERRHRLRAAEPDMLGAPVAVSEDDT